MFSFFYYSMGKLYVVMLFDPAYITRVKGFHTG